MLRDGFRMIFGAARRLRKHAKAAINRRTPKNASLVSGLGRSPPLSLSPPLPLFFFLAWAIAGVVFAGEPSATPVYRGKTVTQWAGELSDSNFWARWYATYALGRIGPDAANAVPALQRVLANLDEEEYVRGGAAWALGRIGPKAASAMPLLIRTLTSKHVSVRRNVAEALGNLAAAGEKQGARAAVSNLVKLLQDEDPAVRVSAAVALWRIQRHPKSIPALESMLRNRDGSTAYLAAVALGDLGAQAERAVPGLVAAVGHSDDDTRRAAAYSLGRIGAIAIPAIRGALAHGDDRTKCQAVEALGWIGPAAVGPLIDALVNPNPPTRRSAARALGRLGAAAKEAEPALVKAVNDPQAEVRDAAAEALRQIRSPT